MAKAQLRVLLIDDEPDMLSLLQAILMDARWDIVGKAADGPEALRIAEAVKPDVAVIDYMLPGMNGLAVADSLKEIDAACHTMIFSAYPGIAAAADARSTVDSFLHKDQVGHLEEVLDEIARRRGVSSAD